MRKISVAGCVFLLLLSGCVSESTIVDNDRPGQPRTDMKEAARTRMSLGLNYLQRGDNTQAKYNLEKAKQLAPDLAEIDNALAYYYEQVGELKQAEDSYRSALRKDSNNADTYNNFGAFLCQHQKYEQAEELLLAAIKRPGYIRVADSYENLALCELEQKNYIQYHQYLKQSLQHNSNRSSALYNMAVIEYAMGNLAEAKRWQSRLHQLGQVSPEATLLRYIVAYYSGDVAEQQTAEKFLLSVYPGSTEAAMLLASDFSQSKPEQMRKAYKSSLMQDDAAATVASNDKPKMKIVKRKSATAAAVVPAQAAALPDSQLPAETTDTAALDTTDTVAVAQIPASLPASTATVTAELATTEPAIATTARTPEQNVNPQPSETVAGTEQVLADSSSNGSVSTEADELAALTAPEPMPVETLTTQVPADTSAKVTTDSTSSLTPQEQQTAQLAEPAVETEGAPSEAASEQSTTSATVANTQALTHKVAAGETLYSIASRYRLSVSELQAMNNLSNAALIKTGQVLKLTAAAGAAPVAEMPAAEKVLTEIPATYQVKDGESMFSISYKYNIKLDTLLKWNNMTVDQPLSIGQTIYLRDPATSSL